MVSDTLAGPEWHPLLNDEPAHLVPAGRDSKLAWWKCQRSPDHVWLAAPYNRTRPNKPSGCPYCAGSGSNLVSVTNSLACRFPSVAKWWHPILNGEIEPRQVVGGESSKKRWWKCTRSPDHEFAATVEKRALEQGCPMCPDSRQPLVSVTNSFATRATPEVVSQWHPTKNRLGPHQVIGRQGATRGLVWFKCPEGPDHDWCDTADARIRRPGCPKCSYRGVGPPSVTGALVGYPALLREWHPIRNDMPPDRISRGNMDDAWWKCARAPDHEWRMPPGKRTGRGDGCVHCARPSKGVSVSNSIEGTNTTLAIQWHPVRNAATASQVVSGNNERHWWKCRRNPGHEWLAAPQKRSALGQGCPWCYDPRRSRVEVDLLFELREHFNHIDPHETLVVTGTAEHRVDIVIPGVAPHGHAGTVIEFDGSHWHSKNFDADVAKTRDLTRHGWFVIRVREGALDPVQPDIDVHIREGASASYAAFAVVQRLQERGIEVPDASRRLSPATRLAASKAEVFWQEWLDLRGSIRAQSDEGDEPKLGT